MPRPKPREVTESDWREYVRVLVASRECDQTRRMLDIQSIRLDYCREADDKPRHSAERKDAAIWLRNERLALKMAGWRHTGNLGGSVARHLR